MSLSLLCCPGVVYEQTCYGFRIEGVLASITFLPMAISVYSASFLMLFCLVAWVLWGFTQEISLLFVGDMHPWSTSAMPRLQHRNVGDAYRLVCRTYPLLSSLSTCAVFFRKYLSGIIQSVGTQSHAVACLQSNAYRSVYADSGAWDTTLLLLFDVIFRATLVLSIVPLSEHSVVEKMSVKLNLELVNLGLTSRCRKNLTLRDILLNLAGCLLLSIVFFLYVMLLTL